MSGNVLKFHPAANIFPLMTEEEFNRLVDDIRKNGQLEPIWLDSAGLIIDGRNRYNACQHISVTPKTRAWDGKGSTVEFVVSLNLHRRHLTPSQCACVGVEMLPLLEAEAKERQAITQAKPGEGKVGLPVVARMPPPVDDQDLPVDPEPVPEFVPEPVSSAGKSREKAAAAAGVGARYVSDAKKLKEEAPAVFEQVRAGEKTLTEAMRSQRKASVSEAAKLPTDKYRIIYADPPWKYGDQLTENYGSVKFHYPSMTISELCLLDIAGIAADNAVLFLWVTSPLLEECFPVIKAWGFKYKTSFVWDKIKHNMGHYNSVRHELLLVCTRGSCLPDVAKLFDSVVSIERAEHSVKPKEFREIIDTIYPNGKRIELFARNEADGWERWGNQA